MPDAPSAPTFLSPAPGARGAKLCGIWSLIASATCVGLPIGIVLAICALVMSAKARRLAREEPDTYERPTATGLVTGIIGLAMPVLMLPFIGIVSAIAIPALLSQRARARDKAAIENMVGRTGDLVGQWDKQRELNTPPDQIPAALEAYLKQAPEKNPWNALESANSAHIEIVSNLDQDEIGEMAASEAIEKGQAVWVIELPEGNRPGLLSGAVRLENEARANPFVKTVAID
ncbi:MAG: hypothetical protein JST05_04440 [Acidobacteria bacterium]|nr:hypothetical protein [Acidobacteriota bacterium]